MARLLLKTTSGELVIKLPNAVTLLEGLQAQGIPCQSVRVYDSSNRFFPLHQMLNDSQSLVGYSMRNTEYTYLGEIVEVAETCDAVCDSIEAGGSLSKRRLTQYSRIDALAKCMESVKSCVDKLFQVSPSNKDSVIQIALSPGGDGRVLAECLALLREARPELRFHATVVAVGFEDEEEHLQHGEALAKRFEFECEVIPSKLASKILGYGVDLHSLGERFRYQFPNAEPEIMLTYWVQEVHLSLAKNARRTAIVFGYNLEDILADRLYQLILNRFLSNYPVRSHDGMFFLAPLYRIPKRILDSMDVSNSDRNYRIRPRGVGYTRSALYFLSYMIQERFPALADALIDGDALSGDPSIITNWLKSHQICPNESSSRNQLAE